MNPLLVAPILEIGKSIINRLWPDPMDAAAAQERLLTMQQAGDFKQLEAELQLALAQIVTNQLDAKGTNWWQKGWRPYIGWICGTGLAYQMLLRPIIQMVVNLAGSQVVLVPLEMDTLLTLLFGLLGLGAMRTFEKLKNVA